MGIKEEDWHNLTFGVQMGNLSSELCRLKSRLEKKDGKNAEHCFERAYEILELTMSDSKNTTCHRELQILKECLQELQSAQGTIEVSIDDLIDYSTQFILVERRVA